MAPGSNQWSLPCEHRASHYAGQENADVKQFKSLLAAEIIKAGIIWDASSDELDNAIWM